MWHYIRRGIHAISLIPTMLLGWDKWSRVATNLYVSKVPFSQEEKSLNSFSEEKQEKYQDQAIGLVVSATENFEINEPILPLFFGNRMDPIRSKEWEEKNIRHLLLDIKDFTSDVNLAQTINDVITIQVYRQEFKKAALVHCKAGRSRSPMIVSATLGTFDLPLLEEVPTYFIRLKDDEFSIKDKELVIKRDAVKKIIEENKLEKNAYCYVCDSKNENVTCLYREDEKLRAIENPISLLDKNITFPNLIAELKLEEKPFNELSTEQVINFISKTTPSRVGSSKQLVETAVAIISHNRPHINLAEGNILTAVQLVTETRKYLIAHPNAIKERAEIEKQWLIDQTKKNNLIKQKREQDIVIKKQIMQLQSYKNLLEYKDKLLKNEPWVKAMLSGPPERVKHIINLLTSMEKSKDDKWQEDLLKLTGPANDLLTATPYWMGDDADQAERESLIKNFKKEVEDLIKPSRELEEKSELSLQMT